MKNMIGLAAMFAFTLSVGWLIWGVGGRAGDIAGGFLSGVICVMLIAVYIHQKGKADGKT